MSSFINFLESTQTNVLDKLSLDSKNGTDSIQLVMGNEAGDADSIVSALSLAHVNDLIFKSSNLKKLSVPLISIPKSDLPLRRDAALLLDIAGIDFNNFIYMDDEITRELLTDVSTSFTLVDHNRIRSSLSHLSEKVTEIVDHHEDEHLHGHVTTVSGHRVIAFEEGFATVASTCTLVAERLFQVLKPTTKIDRALGFVLLGVILLDSVNMLPAAGKGTPRDEAVIQTLLEQTNWSANAKSSSSLLDADTLNRIFPNGRNRPPNRNALFDALSGAKFDLTFWREMSAKDCLRIDYKRFPVSGESMVHSIGISSILMDIRSIIEKQDFYQVMADYIAEENIDIYGVMTMYANDEGNWTRELLLTGRHTKLLDSFRTYLLQHPDAAFLEMEEQVNCVGGKESEGMSIRLFSQGNVKGSRKQLAPVLLSYASTLSKRIDAPKQQ